MKESKRVFKKSLILLPMIIAISIFCYFSYLFKVHEESHYQTIYNDSKYTIDMIAESIESLREQGFKYDKDSRAFDALVGRKCKNAR